ncbi:hypothetical protein [Pararhodobacter zhoushanensis]|uniref:hypothetical protein n=1 Tax=Pararhodobacter zhoushanensis TaxID=2479545 RepID=UPI0013DED91A|nr:hypothetical protein [Pararhodobacter zhoushanensis]
MIDDPDTKQTLIRVRVQHAMALEGVTNLATDVLIVSCSPHDRRFAATTIAVSYNRSVP